ncbi:MAG TPA: nitroreductase family deazaflavin-dependent oxidoreductase [Jiangellaceae bacterium]
MTAARRFANRMMAGLLRVGIGPKRNFLLTTRGRKSGRLHTTPVSLVIDNGQRWLVAPYGAVGWVHNIRANGEATLHRGRSVERVRADEVDAEIAAPVLRRYLQRERIVRSYFDATPDGDLAAFRAEAGRHPVFALVSLR